MNKQRLEAFSDGVFAIVITLLVLDIRIPQIEYSDLPAALHEILPKITSYVISFAIIGVYWVGHHIYFKLVKKTDGIFTWLNILLLLLISFIPFPTSLMGEFPARAIPIMIYGLNLIAVNTVSISMLYYLYKNPELTDMAVVGPMLFEFRKLFLLVNGTYIGAIILSLYAPKVSYLIFIAVLVWLVYLYATRREFDRYE